MLHPGGRHLCPLSVIPGSLALLQLQILSVGSLGGKQHSTFATLLVLCGAYTLHDLAYAVTEAQLCLVLQQGLGCHGMCVAAAVACDVQSAADLAADLTRKVPTKIDIGPVYTHDPRQRAKYAKGKYTR